MHQYSLNQDSLWRINNMVISFLKHPLYASYSIKKYVYDAEVGVHALEVSKNGKSINLFLFYPTLEGNIGSVAIYGLCLEGHLNAILSSMTAFGMPVDRAYIDRSGKSDFVDVYFLPY